ncbi:MAG: hypothetical protein ABI577_15325 [bacterium]
MRHWILLLLSLLSAFAMVISACGGDDDSPAAGGGNDTDYLRAICVGTSNFSNALLSKTNPDDIAKVIKDFIEEMKKLNPPSDLVKYNQDFIKYLEDAVADPTSLVTRTPPLPSKDAQHRIAALEPSISECKDGTFFSRAATATP